MKAKKAFIQNTLAGALESEFWLILKNRPEQFKLTSTGSTESFFQNVKFFFH